MVRRLRRVRPPIIIPMDQSISYQREAGYKAGLLHWHWVGGEDDSR